MNLMDMSHLRHPIPTNPKITTAVVRLFSGEFLTIWVDEVWIYQGVPLRIWGKDKDGKSCKFKSDEEPFTLTFQPEED